jgi:hypothetical protein
MLHKFKGLSLFKLPYLRTQPKYKDTKYKPIYKLVSIIIYWCRPYDDFTTKINHKKSMNISPNVN